MPKAEKNKHKEAPTPATPDENFKQAKKALKSGKGKVVQEPTEPTPVQEEQDLADFARGLGVTVIELEDDTPVRNTTSLEDLADELGIRLDELEDDVEAEGFTNEDAFGEPETTTAIQPLTTFPHGKFDLNIPEDGTAQLYSFLAREHAIDLTLKPRPTEQVQKTLHDARVSRFKHGDPIVTAAVAATDPFDTLPANITLSTPDELYSNANPLPQVPADIQAMKQPNGRPLTRGQVLLEMVRQAQQRANATGERQQVVVPQRYVTKNYGNQLMKNFNERPRSEGELRLFVEHARDEFRPDASAKGGGGFEITLTVAPDPSLKMPAPADIPPVPKGMEYPLQDGLEIPVEGGGIVTFHEVSAKIEPQDVQDVLDERHPSGKDKPEAPKKAKAKDKPVKKAKGKKGNVINLAKAKAKRA